jgi:hypothetical protein
VVCALPDAGLQIGPCAGDLVPGAVTKRSDQARSLLTRAGASGRVKQTRHLVLKAAKALRNAAQQSAVAGKRGHLSPVCADALRSSFQDAAARAAQLAAAL